MTWEIKTIGDLGKVVTGKTPPTNNQEFYDGRLPFITPSDLDWASYAVTQTGSTVTELAGQRFKNQLLPAGATFVTCIGNTIGKIGLAAGDCISNQQINSIIANDHHDPKFLYYLMCHHRRLIRSIGLGGGAAQPIINKSTFSRIEVKTPKRWVQEKIAATLSAYDDLIAVNTRRIALLEEAARLLHRNAVTFADKSSGSWKSKKFGDVMELVKLSVQPKDFVDTDIHIGLAHLPRRSFTLSNWEGIESLESSKYRFKKDDILFCKIRPYFHKVGFALRDGLASSDTLVWRIKEPGLWALALTVASSDHFVAVASKTVKEGSKMPRANWKVLKDYPVDIPPESKLHEFSLAVENIASQCRTLAFQNHTLARARDLLLPRLMDGRIELAS